MSYADDQLRFEPWPYKPGGIPDPCRAKFYMEAIGSYADARAQLDAFEDKESDTEERISELNDLATEHAAALKTLASQLEDAASGAASRETLADIVAHHIADIEKLADKLAKDVGRVSITTKSTRSPPHGCANSWPRILLRLAKSTRVRSRI